MNSGTVRRLNAINRAFYQVHAEHFSRTRQNPWKGWRPLLNRLWSETTIPDELKVLDVGCGNGRFGSFLNQWLQDQQPLVTDRKIHYCGFDESEELLDDAQHRFLQEDWGANRCESRFDQATVLSSPAWPILEPQDLAVCFGVFHHVPGRENRRAVLEELCERVSARPGVILASFWCFERDPRLLKRIVSWEDFNQSAELDQQIETADLESGDFLLPWGPQDRAKTSVRYCHAFSQLEIDELIESLDLEVLFQLTEDGRQGDLNVYLALRPSQP